jgi:hypothetical protein
VTSKRLHLHDAATDVDGAKERNVLHFTIGVSSEGRRHRRA